MLTKIGVAALLGAIGTAVVGGGTARADEGWRREPVAAPVVVAAPVATPVAYGFGHDRDDGFGRDRDGRFGRDRDGRFGYGRDDGYGRPGVYYRHDRREELERMRREQREEAFRHARWLHRHDGFGDRW